MLPQYHASQNENIASRKLHRKMSSFQVKVPGKNVIRYNMATSQKLNLNAASNHVNSLRFVSIDYRSIKAYIYDLFSIS